MNSIPKKDRIARQEMVDALRRSGYLLEQRVRSILGERGYYVQTNSAYPDPETGKSREYDISAIGATRLYKKTLDFIFPVVICECENNDQPVAFFVTESQVPFCTTRK